MAMNTMTALDQGLDELSNYLAPLPVEAKSDLLHEYFEDLASGSGSSHARRSFEQFLRNASYALEAYRHIVHSDAEWPSDTLEVPT